jgi:hypothetical protein
MTLRLPASNSTSGIESSAARGRREGDNNRGAAILLHLSIVIESQIETFICIPSALQASSIARVVMMHAYRIVTLIMAIVLLATASLVSCP